MSDVRAMNLLKEIGNFAKLRTHCLFIAGVCASLVALWFKNGLMLAYAESGFPFYNPQTNLDLSRYAWFDWGLGFPSPNTIPGATLYLYLAMPEIGGVQPWIAQAGIFWILLFAGAAAVFKITTLTTRPIDGKGSRFAGLVAGLFYVLNPLAMSLLWNRFLLSFIFFYTLIAVSLFLYIAGTSRRQFRSCAYFAFVSTALSYAFTMPAVIGTFWLTFILLAAFQFLVVEHTRNGRIFVLKFFGLSVMLWTLVNSWWLLPFAQIVAFSSNSIGGGVWSDVPTFVAISNTTTPFYTLRMIYHFYQYEATFWTLDYFGGWFEFSSLLAPVLAFSVFLMKGPKAYAHFFGLLTLLGVFLANGAAPPLGIPFLWVYERLPILGVYRNPLETLGIVIPLGLAPLVGSGVAHLREIFSSPAQRRTFRRPMAFVSAVLPALVVAVLLVVNVLPMWTGSVFQSRVPPTNDPQVGFGATVPTYYTEAGDWLEQRVGSYNVLGLPLTTVGVTLDWSAGYAGVDVDTQLLGVPVISSVRPGSPEADLTLTAGKLVFEDGMAFWKAVALTHSMFVIVHRDFNYSARSAEIERIPSAAAIEDALAHPSIPAVSNGAVDLSSSNVTRLADCSEIQGNVSWVWYDPTRGQPQIETDVNDTMQSDCGIFATGYAQFAPYGTPYEYNFGIVVRVPISASDWSTTRYLHAWIKGNHSNRMVFQASDSVGRTLNWDQRFDSLRYSEVGNSTWRLYSLPVLPFYQLSENFDYGNMTRILISEETTNNATESALFVGGVYLDNGIPAKSNIIRHARTFGQIPIFELDPAYRLPKVYGSYLWEVLADRSNMSKVLYNESYQPGKTIMVSPLEEQSPQSSNAPGNSPLLALDFERLNPSHFSVKVNAERPFWLVLGVPFDAQWSAYIRGQSNKVGIHAIADGYANGWYVPLSGDLTIDLLFDPQKSLDLGFAIALAGGTLAIASCTNTGREILGRLLRRIAKRPRGDKPKGEDTECRQA